MRLLATHGGEPTVGAARGAVRMRGADGPPDSAAARSCSQLNGVSPLGTQAADQSEDRESLPLNRLPSFCERCRSRQDSSLESPLLVFNVNLTGNLRSLWI